MKTAKKGVPGSVLIADLAVRLDGERVSVGNLLDCLEGRGLGVLLLILSLPLCVPNVPGISTIFGILLIAPSIQMMTRQKSVAMPKSVRNWSFKGDGLRWTLRACSKLLRKVEFLAKPRLSGLTQWPATAFAGAQTFVLALILLLPMPGANVIPGVAVALTGLAILQRDGVSMLASTAVALGAVAWVYFGAKYVIASVMWLYEAGMNLWNSVV